MYANMDVSRPMGVVASQQYAGLDPSTTRFWPRFTNVDTVNTSSMKRIGEFLHSFNLQTAFSEAFGGGMPKSGQELLPESKRFGYVFLLSVFPMMA